MTDNYDCFIDADSVFSGTLKTKDIGIEGIYFGEINAKEHTTLAEGGTIIGNLDSKQAMIEGTVKGHIHVSETVTLSSTSMIESNVVSSKLIVEEGANLSGYFIINPNKQDREKLQKKENVDAQSPQTVTFSFSYPKAKAVALVGSFNHWNQEKAISLKKTEDNKWQTQFCLIPGTYEYLVLVDGKSEPDPNNPEKTPNSYGGENSVLVIS